MGSCMKTSLEVQWESPWKLFGETLGSFGEALGSSGEALGSSEEALKLWRSFGKLWEALGNSEGLWGSSVEHLIRKSKGNGWKSFQAYFLFIFY